MSAEPASSTGVVTKFGSRISRDTAIYFTSMASGLVSGIVTLAVFTRFLDPEQYGELAVMFVFAGLLTTLYNTCFLQGTFMWVYGVSEGEEVDADAAPTAPAGAKRRALGSGFVLSLVVAVAGTAVVVVLARPVGALLLGDSGRIATVAWAAASAGLGSVWRLVVNVFRMERRPVAFAWLNTLRPICVLAVGIPLVATNHGVDGALAGTTVGTGVAAGCCLMVGRRSYILTLARRDVTEIVRRGRRYFGVQLGLGIVHNADLLLLSWFAPTPDVGLYRVASRVASVPSYFVSAFLMAWSPLERTSLFAATYRRRGQPGVRGSLFTYYMLGGFALVLFMALASDLLVRIAAHAYADAAALIPLMAAGFVIYGAFLTLARVARTPRRTYVYGTLCLACAAVLVLVALVLIPWLGAYGAALSLMLAMALGCLAFVVLICRSEEPIPFEGGRLLGGLALSAACFGVGVEGGTLVGRWQPLLEVAVLVAYPLLLVAFGVVPRDHVRPLLRIARSALPSRARNGELLERLSRVPRDDRLALERAIRDRQPLSAVAAELNVEQPTVQARVVAALRTLSGLGPPSPHDSRLGHLLLFEGPSFERDVLAQSLWDEGVDPLEIHDLETAVGQLRRVPRGGWPQEQVKSDALRGSMVGSGR